MNYRALVLIGLSALGGSAHAFSRLVVFGDSLSDTGNLHSLSGGTYPPAPYWQGRMSNGPVWVERLAANLGLSAAPLSQGGPNFAFINARTGSGTASGVLDLTDQVNFFLSTGSANANDLAVVWAGANDFINGESDSAAVAGRIGANLTNLRNAGIRHFLVLNLPRLGYTPQGEASGFAAILNARTDAFNVALAGQLGTLATPGTNVYAFDVASLAENVRANPASYGFTNITEPAWNGSTVVPNPDEYLFWDGGHFTRTGHALVGDLATQAVPEPATLAALGFGALAALRRRRR